MTVAGGHGGSSERETYVPLLVWTSDSVHRSSFEVTNVQQIDLVPTISLLLSLGIPEKNVGILLDGHFSIDLSILAEKIKLNAEQFHSLARANKGLFTESELSRLFKSTAFSLKPLISTRVEHPKLFQEAYSIHILFQMV